MHRLTSDNVNGILTKDEARFESMDGLCPGFIPVSVTHMHLL